MSLSKGHNQPLRSRNGYHRCHITQSRDYDHARRSEPQKPLPSAFNRHSFSNPSAALSSLATFGRFRAASTPRVFQFALRYEF